MGIRIDHEDAKTALFKAAKEASEKDIHSKWGQQITTLTKACKEANTYTHIAFIGTAILAKVVDDRVDVYSVKARASENAYSARSLCQHVLAAHAIELKIDLGVSGREPLNNQPYFRIDRFSDDIPIRKNAKAIITTINSTLQDLDKVKNRKEALQALRAFIAVRRLYVKNYDELRNNVKDSVAALLKAIDDISIKFPEGGKIAQATCAGVIDTLANPKRIKVGRINDPDRHIPGDVGIIDKLSSSSWEKVFEVRYKAVKEHDIYHFIRKLAENNLSKGGILAISPAQPSLNNEELVSWAQERGVLFFIYESWEDFVLDIIYWADGSSERLVPLIIKHIHRRLIEIEASEEALSFWVASTSSEPNLDLSIEARRDFYQVHLLPLE